MYSTMLAIFVKFECSQLLLIINEGEARAKASESTAWVKAWGGGGGAVRGDQWANKTNR